jgi:hypothetical protein
MTSNQNDRLDEATAQRLARLRSMPVDTSRLDQFIQAEIPRQDSKPSGLSIFFHSRPVRAIAAGVGMLLMIGVVMWSLTGGAVLASPDTMAKFHEELVSGRVAAVRVDTIADANRTLADQWNMGVELPSVPQEHVMLCCMRNIKDKHVACVLLRSDGGVPVTMAVAKAMDMRLPADSQTVVSDGVTYHIESSGKLNMVMSQRQGRWICLIGELPPQRLIHIAGAIEF